MLNVFVQSFGIYQNVVKICDAELVEIVSQYVVDERLKGGRGVGQPKGHNQVFIMTISCAECGFLFFFFFYSDQIVLL